MSKQSEKNLQEDDIRAIVMGMDREMKPTEVPFNPDIFFPKDRQDICLAIRREGKYGAKAKYLVYIANTGEMKGVRYYPKAEAGTWGIDRETVRVEELKLKYDGWCDDEEGPGWISGTLLFPMDFHDLTKEDHLQLEELHKEESRWLASI